MTWIGSTQLRREAGISPRQLDHWTTIGALEAHDPNPGTGAARRYHPREVMVARTLKLYSRFVGKGGCGTYTLKDVGAQAREAIDRRAVILRLPNDNDAPVWITINLRAAS